MTGELLRKIYILGASSHYLFTINYGTVSNDSGSYFQVRGGLYFS